MTKPNSCNKGGMGMLLVLFPQDNKSTIADKPKLNFPTPSKSLLSKAQSTVSICALLLFTTLLLFTLSAIPNTPPTIHTPLSHTHHFALHRMGTLYRRGTTSMNTLIVCHVSDDTPLDHFRFFLRLLHRSSLTASSDVVFIFPSPPSTSKFAPIIRQENHAFSSLLHSHFNSTRPKSTFDPNQPVWGSKIRANLSNRHSLSYGSVLSFDATELDPENSLAGFLDRVPLTLRRWACYPMLLGRVRRNFKHVLLVDVKNVVIFKDPLGRVRNRSPDSVFLFAKAEKRSRKSQLTQSTQRPVLSAVVMGGARGVRRLSNIMAVEIVRAATQHKKKKNPVSESVVLSQLVGDEFILKSKNVNLIASAESIPEASSLAAHNSGASTSFSSYAIIQRGVNNHDLNYVIKKQICSSEVDSSVYRDC
ncbi:uncharacterized protein LOC113863083 [Abrus precatorius]|uniref:Uncharacterized protein LOC113863083 n=1 Tax=Abrus precatorius TaxID=3816 RepID=A0A8B8LC32_ABRPR|nr:uncharacterized protein LOC113863083 [Abrus precatorius]